MGALLGPVGGLEILKGATKLRSNQEPRHTFSHTLGGVRRAYRGPAPRRTWDVEVGTAKPEEWHILSQLAAGLLGDELVWYDELAQVSNILPPDVSKCDGPAWEGGVQAGARSPVVLEDGARFLRSIQGRVGEWMTMPIDVPVNPIQHVVAAAYVTPYEGTTATLRVEELDPEGVVVEQHDRTVTAPDTLQRLIVQTRTTERTAMLRLQAHNALTLALPSVTMTKNPVPWAEGRGCLTAVVDLHGEDVQKALETPTDWGRRSAYSFTITELG